MIRPQRFRFRLGTSLLVVAILALLLVVAIEQVQIGKMRQAIDAGAKRGLGSLRCSAPSYAPDRTCANRSPATHAPAPATSSEVNPRLKTRGFRQDWGL